MTSRRDQKQAMREERMRKQQEAKEAAQRKRLILYVAGAIAAVAVAAAIAFVVITGGDDDSGAGKGGGTKDPGAFPAGSVPPEQPVSLEDAAKAADCKIKDEEQTQADHVEGNVDYDDNPPIGGDHFEIPADDGPYYSEPPATESSVHSLEHGRINIQFKPEVPDETKGNLKALFDEDPHHILLFPNQTKMPHEVAATAWGHSLTCAKMNDKVYDAIRAFKFRWRDKGPENVP
jgi:Protein of unknown function (DUF3105)